MKELCLYFGNGEYEILSLMARRSPQCNLENLIKKLIADEFNRVINFDDVVKNAWEEERKKAFKDKRWE